MGTAKERRSEARSWLWFTQDGKCAICKREIRVGKGAVDHDHVTGLIRGLLCIPCNCKLGNKVLSDCLFRSKTARHEGIGCHVCDNDKVWWRKAYIYLRTQELRQKRLIAFDCVMY